MGDIKKFLKMKFSFVVALAIFSLAQAQAESEIAETKVAEIDNFLNNPGLDTAVDLAQWFGTHFAGAYSVYLLIFQWTDELSQYNSFSELISWDFAYAVLKYIDPAVSYLYWVIDGGNASWAYFFSRITLWKILYNTFCGSNCDFNREAEYDVFEMFN